MADYQPAKPPKEALDYFKKKKLKPAFDYRDVWREEHAVSFTVAKAVKLDILKDIQDGLRETLAEGKSFFQFRKELTPLLQKKGWWGKREMIDPETGETKLVQLGSPRRLKTIFDANLRTARAAGQWDRIQRTKKALPYLIYELGPSREHRPHHKQWAGLILPVDDPFWKTHFTPNGWGCKCRIRQISKREHGRLVATGKYETTAPNVEYVKWENKRTGLIENVPEGIDPSWDTNAGYLRQINIDRSLVTKTLALDSIDDPSKLFISPIRKAEYKTWASNMQATNRAGGALHTIAVLGLAEISFLGKQGKAPNETLTVVEGRLMSQSGGNKPSKAARHKTAGNALSASQWQTLPTLIQQAEHILWHSKQKQFVYLIKQGDGYLKLVVSVDFKSRKAKKQRLEEKLNMLRTAFKINEKDVRSLLKSPDYEQVK